jgi:dTDP-4-dehydrorhamnose reductase
VGQRYFDQLRRSGHDRRLGDFDRFAELRVSALRHPVLWERIAPDQPDELHWEWPDERLGRLRTLGIRPIVGLLHHGSGPRYTDLLDPAFPEKLASYARAVAERYPWVQDWTPVNEPLTTARFSALYGHWYPHRSDAASFLRALVNQCKATVLAMNEIRAVNPAARLVSTEDLGHTFSTPALAYQAEFENARRWASLDLLCGTPAEAGDPFWSWALRNGLDRRDLAWFTERASAPDVVGINHYPTSQRYLDERLEGFPLWSHGGNGRERYADVEAVRARRDGIRGIGDLLRETALRYRCPVAVTECHIWSTREQQMRWLADVWADAHRERERGIDVRAVTVWALLGTFDWDRLVVEESTHYESGVFDVRGSAPRATALAALARELAVGKTPSHPAVRGPRWWRSPERLIFGSERQSPSEESVDARPILIAGARGTLARAFARVARDRGLEAVALGRPDLDITDPVSIATAMDRVRPWAVVNAAGYVRVDDAEQDPECERENAHAAFLLARETAGRRIKLVTFSTDLVFDGAKRTPYVESDEVRPLSAYGRSKTLAERFVRETDPRALIVRSSSFFGPWDQANFVAGVLRDIAHGRPVRAAEDVVVSPTYVPDLVNETLDLLIDDERGLWHVAGPEPVTWHELARRAADLAGLPASLVEACSAAALDWVAARPGYSALGSERAMLLPPLDDALARMLRDAPREAAAAA